MPVHVLKTKLRAGLRSLDCSPGFEHIPSTTLICVQVNHVIFEDVIKGE